MFVAEYWWLFLILGVVFVGMAFYRQVRAMNDLTGGNTFDPRLEGKADPRGGFFAGFALTAVLALLGAIGLLLGFIGLIVTLVRG
jgi:hypothetical protein